jgi:hypothetical protein
MLQSLSHSLGRRQRIADLPWTKFYERRVVVRNGSINTVPRCTPSGSQILRAWIPDSIVILKWYRSELEFEFGKERHALKSILFELNSRLTRIESDTLYLSSLESILIPRNIEILESNCFSNCRSLSSITFESNPHLTRIESEAFSFSLLQSIVNPRNVQFIDGSAFINVSISSISIDDLTSGRPMAHDLVKNWSFLRSSYSSIFKTPFTQSS